MYRVHCASAAFKNLLLDREECTAERVRRWRRYGEHDDHALHGGDIVASPISAIGCELDFEAQERLPYYSWEEIRTEQLNPLNTRKVIFGKKLTMAQFISKKGSVVPTHKHRHEQVTFMIKGRVRFAVGGEERMTKEGDVIYIPPNVEHSAVCVEDSIGIDVFTPIREDWLAGNDAYLRGSPAPKKGKSK